MSRSGGRAAAGRRGPEGAREAGFDAAALKAVGSLLGSPISSAAWLSGEVARLELQDGRRLVWKRVPRQWAQRWKPGGPWAELAALDALSALGGPVPALVACDLENGWLIVEHVEGVPLDELPPSQRSQGWTSLVESYFELERRFEEAWDDLASFAEVFDDETESLARGVLALFPHNPAAESAWLKLTREALRGKRTPGSLDLRAANALLAGHSVVFLDFATIGLERPEKRLVAYARRPDPLRPGLLEFEGFLEYAGIAGEDGALRLAFFDFLYWGLFLARCKAVLAAPSSSRLSGVRAALGDPAAAYEGALRMWARPRLDDERVRKVASLAHPLLEARERVRRRENMEEWKPRGRDVVIGGVPWLARCADKARAKAEGTIGDYIYPCPIDQRFLAEAGISPEDFMALATSAKTDEELVAKFKERSKRQDWSDFRP